jgi:SAM-dependent methyltransferase
LSEGNGNGALKLNIGSGDAVTMKGYVNVDAKFGDTAYPLKYGDNCVDEIYASHILEHFSQHETLNVLKDWARALRPGGVLKIAVPHFDWIVKEYTRGNPDRLPLSGYLMGSQTDENDYHKAIFNEVTLRRVLLDAGLVDIQPWQSEVNDCAALPVSLNLMGRKPEVSNLTAMGEQIAEAKPNGNGKHFVAGQWREEGNAPGQVRLEKVEVQPIGLATSTPRYGSLIASDTMWMTALAMGALPARSGGAWWEQGLSRQIEKLLAEGTQRGPIEFIFTVDFDSYMTAEDGINLLRLMYENPHLDCIVPMQVRRGMFEEVLAQTDGPVTITDPLVPIVHGHFGFTLFRRRVFERMSKPWMLNVPDPEGGWNEGRTDADIFMWHKFCDEGFKAAMATQVVIGHGDEMICWPRFENGKVVKVYQSVFEWIQTRKPPASVLQP